MICQPGQNISHRQPKKITLAAGRRNEIRSEIKQNTEEVSGEEPEEITEQGEDLKYYGC
jgi:hypothetical protein